MTFRKKFISSAVLPLVLLIISLNNPTIVAHSPESSPTASPSPPGPPKIITILKKAGHFNTLIRLLKKTKMDDRIFSLLNNSNQITVFAPNDEAFSRLPQGTLKSFSYQQRIQLVQFNIANELISFPDFETTSNPLSTQAGDNSNFKFPLNVTVVGDKVNVTTGIDNATVTGTVFMDDLLAVYEVDRVLLPWRFCHSSASSCGLPAKPEEALAPTLSVADAQVSDAMDVACGGEMMIMLFVASIVASFSWGSLS